ncbi:MAG: hypothetical protein Kow0031_34880 [Anaerolineae bacterium]
MKLQRTLFALVTLLAGLMLAGCINAQTTVGIYGNEQWSGVTALQLSAEFAQMIEQADQSGGETSMEMNSQEIEQWLAQAQQAAGRSDISVDFQEIKGDDGSRSYVLSGSGQGLEALNQIFFNGEADIATTEVNGQRQITIKANMAGSNEQSQELTPEEQAMQQQMIQAMGIGVSFKLSGGEIISSNATRVEGNTAIWENPSQIEVTLTEAPDFDPAMVALTASPAGASGATALSPQALTTLMEGIVAEMEKEQEQSRELMTAQAAPEAETSTGPAAGGNTTTPEAELGNAAPQAEAAPQNSNGNAGASTEADSATSAPGAVAGPTEADANLPSSGGILPEQSVATVVALAGLLLLIMTGGALAALRRQL